MARQRSQSGGPTRTLILLLAAGLVVVAGAGVAVAAQDQFEPNDEPDSAAAVDDGTYEGLSLSGGVDYYEFDLSEGETLNATVEFTHDDGDVDIRLYNSDERPIAESASFEDQESISHTANGDETVQLMVYTEGSRSNDYSLTVSTEGGAAQSDSDDGDSESDGDSSMDSSDGNDESSSGGSDSDGNSADGSSSDGNSDSDGSSDGGSDDSGDDGLSGFGVLVALAALAAVGAAARDR